MGYRSDLYIKGKLPAFPNLYHILHKHSLKPDSLCSDEEYFYLTLCSYKWYDGYEEVDEINRFIYSSSGSEACYMVRDGEDLGDIETYKSANYQDLGMRYSTQIVFEGFKETSETSQLKQLFPEAFI